MAGAGGSLRRDLQARLGRVLVIARCVHGLEWVSADEVSNAPGVSGLTLGRRELTFSAPLTPALLELATVDDVFACAGRFGGVGSVKASLPALAEGLSRLPWWSVVEALAQVRAVPASPLIDVVASLEGRRSYSRFAVEQVAGEVLSRTLGGRYLRRDASGREPGDPDLTVRLFLRSDQVIAAVRLGREPLHRRAYKQATGPGTLHPPVAAALARLALARLALGPASQSQDQRVRPETSGRTAPSRAQPVILDPFCGDGTLAIEAARLAGERVLARDADPDRVANARENASRAGVSVDLAVTDAGASDDRADRVDLVITNPPWNLAVDAAGSLARSLEPFWRRLASQLAPDGQVVLLADDALDAAKALRGNGFALGVVQPVRLNGRIAQVIVATPPGAPVLALSGDLQRWRAAADAAGAGFS